MEITLIAQEVVIDFQKLLPYAFFGVFFAGAWLLMESLGSGKSRTIDRLENLVSKNPARADEKTAQERKREAMNRIMEKASPTIEKLQPKSEAELSKLKVKLTSAGFRSPHAQKMFYACKGIGIMVGGMILLGVMGLGGTGIKNTVFAIALGGLMYYIPDFTLSFLASSRKQKIFLGLPDALDLMVVCVEAGLGLDQAMRKVSEELIKSHPTVAEEFAIANFQLQMGRPRADVLHELGLRTDVDDLRSLASVLIQADKFGASVSSALRIQSDTMRTRRKQLAEEKAAKTAVQLLFPMVLFIFPCVFIVLVGPAAISMINNLGMMTAGSN